MLSWSTLRQAQGDAFDGLATATLYLNGDPQSTNSNNLPIDYYVDSVPTISPVGYLDEFELYLRALSDAQIKNLVEVPILDVDFETLSDLSNRESPIYCLTDRCPTASRKAGGFEETQFLTVTSSNLELSSGQFTFATWINPKPLLLNTDSEIDPLNMWQGIFGRELFDEGSIEFIPGQYDDEKIETTYPAVHVRGDGHIRFRFGKADDATNKCSYTCSSKPVQICTDLVSWPYRGHDSFALRLTNQISHHCPPKCE